LTHYHRKGGDPAYKMDVVNKWKERFTSGGFRVIVPVDDGRRTEPTPGGSPAR